jgi:hypothetical protein
METIVIFFILVTGTFLAGLFFFIRSLKQKRHLGCGLTGLLVALSIGLFVCFFWDIVNYQSDDVYKENFERWAGQPFPPSGKIIKKKHDDAIRSFRDKAVIKMDTLDYDRLLSAIQCDSSFKRVAIEISEYAIPFSSFRIPVSEFKFLFRKESYEMSLWFHENRRTVVYDIINY